MAAASRTEKMLSMDQVVELLNHIQTQQGAEVCPSDDEILARFDSDSELRGLAGGTRASYRSISRTLQTYLSDSDLELTDMNLQILIGFLAELRSRDYSQSTIANYFSAISTLCEYMVFEGWLPSNPVRVIEKRYLRMYKKKRIGFSTGERKLISIEEMPRLINSTLDIRNKAIITLLAKTGIRRDELIRIDLRDINWENQSIRLKKHPKRSNTLIFFDDETARVLKAYLQIRSARASREEKALFVGERGTRLKRRGVYDLVTKQAAKVGLHDPNSKRAEERFTPHCCRHWFTTWMDRSGINREYLKELRGDVRGETVDIHRHIDSEELRKAYLAHVPELGI